MAVSRVAAATIAELTTDVRRELGDPATTPAGDTIPAGLRRYSDTEIERVINNALIAIQLKIANRHPGQALVAVSFSYTEAVDADPPGNDLPAGVDANGVFKVEDMAAPSGISEPLGYVSLLELQRYERTEDVATTLISKYWYTLVDRALNHGIIIRPRPPAGHAFRVWYVAQPLVYSATSDAPALATRFRDFIAMTAAMSLASPSQQTLSDVFFARLKLATDDFNSWYSRNRGPVRVRKAERGRW